VYEDVEGVICCVVLWSVMVELFFCECEFVVLKFFVGLMNVEIVSVIGIFEMNVGIKLY